MQDAHLHCLLSASTSGWVAVGFDPSSIMQDANFIIGYVDGGIGEIRDDWGTGATSHASDVSLGGSSDVTLLTAAESGGVTTLEFTIPMNSGDAYDKVLSIGSSYSCILAQGSSDSYTSYHSAAGFATIVPDSTTTGGGGSSADPAVTSGPDIALDTDVTGFTTVMVDDFTFSWKVVTDSLRCMLTAPTTGWLAVGFDPTDDMLNANFIIGYTIADSTWVRDDFGVTTTAHSADYGLGGTNNVSRVFGRESNGFTEIRFTIPLNSGDSYDRVIVPGTSYEVLFAHGSNGADDFNSMHADEEDTDVIF